MNRELILSREVRQLRDFVRAVQRANLRYIRETQHAGQGSMNVPPPLDCYLQRLDCDFSVCTFDWNDPDPLIQEADCIAFVGFDMGMAVAEDAVVGRTIGANRQAVCGRTVEHKEDFAIGVEQCSEALFRFCCEFIGAVADDVSLIKTLKRLKYFRAAPGVVVARELASMIEVPHGDTLMFFHKAISGH
jgi:hypothetical protein